MPIPQLQLFPPFNLDAANGQLKRGKQRIALRRKTFEMLCYLVDRPQELVTKEALLDALWPDVIVSDSMPSICVAELRKALGDDPREPIFIETVHGRGYRFVAKVEIAGAIASSSRLASAPQDPPVIMVGRATELARLQGFFRQTLAGARRVIFVAGEAGIGKTTLVRAFLRSISDNRVRIGYGQCVERYGRGEPYMPVLEALTRLGQEAGGERVVEILDRLAPSWLAQMPALLSEADRTRLQAAAQNVARQRMLRELLQALEALTTDSPLVLFIEDLHWCDFSSLELISAVARRTEPARLLVIGNYRPIEMLTSDHPLLALKVELELHKQCEELRLELLSRSDVAAYLAERFADLEKHSLESLVPVIHERSDGNPLFMVNMVDSLVKNGSPFLPGKFEPPRSILQMIERNLQRLSADEQTILETASVVGAEFSAAAVAAGLECPVSAVETCCTRLSRHEQFVTAQGISRWPDGTRAAHVRFHHALYRDVLYDRVPPSRQIELHRRIAARLEQGYGAQVGEIAAELADHYRRANDGNKSAAYFHLAGERAADRRAYREAEQHYRDALAMLLSMPESTERKSRELISQLALGGIMVATRGWSDVKTAAVYSRARALADRAGAAASLQVFNGIWASVATRGELHMAVAIADQMLDLARGIDHPRALFLAHYAQGVRFALGDLASGAHHFLKAAEYYREDDFRDTPDDPGAMSLVWAGLIKWLMGYPAQARRLTDDARRLALRLNKSFALAYTNAIGAVTDGFLGDFARASAASKEAERVSTDFGFPIFNGLGKIAGAWSRAEMGEVGDAVASIRSGLLEIDAVRFYVFRTLYLSILTQTQVLAGSIDDALVSAQEALEANPDELFCRPWMFQLRGELFLRRPVHEQNRLELAEHDFREAIGLAREIGAKSLELRATISLARLPRKRGRRDEALAELAEIYAWFTEGHDTADLEQARTLLES